MNLRSLVFGLAWAVCRLVFAWLRVCIMLHVRVSRQTPASSRHSDLVCDRFLSQKRQKAAAPPAPAGVPAAASGQAASSSSLPTLDQAAQRPVRAAAPTNLKEVPLGQTFPHAVMPGPGMHARSNLARLVPGRPCIVSHRVLACGRFSARSLTRPHAKIRSQSVHVVARIVRLTIALPLARRCAIA